MNLYSIKFAGLNPVGAVALVVAPNEPTAGEQFKEFWKQAHPVHNPEPLEINRIVLRPGMVMVLLDGEY